PHMAVPPDIGGATEEVPVVGRSQASGLFVNEDFKIGPFEVANVSRGAKHSSRFGAFWGFKSSEESGYSYDFKRGDLSLHGECVLDVSASGADLGSLTIGNEHRRFACACGDEKAPVAGVVMTASTLSKYGGKLKAHDSTYDLQAIYDREGAASDGNPAGYRVDAEGVQGAVDVLGPGRVWLAKTLEGDRRTDVACVFAGLLLFKPTMKH
ncbi:MAG TPA: hypothetical protein VE987_06865, partial [Polyangiaceae bacterium]|nr:hypothetical protein [Polyangiaceae bacterium]